MLRPGACVLLTLGVLLAHAATSAAADRGMEEIRWTEEVRLHDGSVVRLQRRMELTRSGFPVQRRGSPKFHEFCYPPLGIHWKSKPVYLPELFDVVGGKAYVRVPLTGCTECMLHGHPDADALYFVWDAPGWRKIDAQAFPAGLRFNLMLRTYSNDDGQGDARGLVTLAEKARRDAAVHIRLQASGHDSPFPRGECRRCRSVRVDTDRTAEVFIGPPGRCPE